MHVSKKLDKELIRVEIFIVETALFSHIQNIVDDRVYFLDNSF